MAHSHITISGLDDQFVSVINADINYYINSTTGSDAVGIAGSSDAPFRTLGRAFEVLRDKKIAKTATVTINIADVVDVVTAYNESEIVVDHPDGERINVVGQTPISLTARNYNYYQTAPSVSMGGANAAIGGYILEIGVDSTANIQTGDFAVIREQNYTPSGIVHTTVAGETGNGPTAFETDFGGSGDNYMATGENGVSGATAQGASVSLRKLLAVGAHEILATGGSSTFPHLVVHIRHNNHMLTSGFTQAVSCNEAFVTPQGIQYSTSSPATPGTPISNYAGHSKKASNTFVTASSAPGGFTGSLPFLGGNGMTACGNIYEKLMTTAAAQRHTNIGTVQVYRTRLNFDNSNGINVKNGGKLGKLSNVVLCGRGHRLDGGTYEFTDGVTGNGISVSDNAMCVLENVSICGFQNGLYVDQSMVYGTGVVSSANYYGLYSENQGSISADYCMFTGNSYGVYAKASNIDSNYNLFSANWQDGFNIKDTSKAKLNRSISAFNGGYGYSVKDNSNLDMMGSATVYQAKTGTNTTATDGTTSDFNDAAGVLGTESTRFLSRFGKSRRDGCISFRNADAGIYVANNSGVHANSNRISFNRNGGVKMYNGGFLNSHFGNYFENGATFNTGVGGGVFNGIHANQNCNIDLRDGGVIHNTQGVVLEKNSSANIVDSTITKNTAVHLVIQENSSAHVTGGTFATAGLVAGVSMGGAVMNMDYHSMARFQGTTSGIGGGTIGFASNWFIDTYTEGQTGAVVFADGSNAYDD